MPKPLGIVGLQVGSDEVHAGPDVEVMEPVQERVA